MSAHSRRKGRRRELELARLLGARRISEAGLSLPDLEWQGRHIEVKARANGTGFKFLYDNLANAQILGLKADRRDWLVVMPVHELLDLLDEAKTGR